MAIHCRLGTYHPFGTATEPLLVSVICWKNIFCVHLQNYKIRSRPLCDKRPCSGDVRGFRNSISPGFEQISSENKRVWLWARVDVQTVWLGWWWLDGHDYFIVRRDWVDDDLTVGLWLESACWWWLNGGPVDGVSLLVCINTTCMYVFKRGSTLMQFLSTCKLNWATLSVPNGMARHGLQKSSQHQT